MSEISRHPDSETLLRFVDEDLPPSKTSAIRDHQLACDDCRDRIQWLREALDDYARFHRDVLMQSVPPPPRAWAQLEFPQTKSPRWRPVRWLAAAAAIAAVFLLIRRFDQAPEVRAAELLRKAAVAEQSRQPSHTRIHIRSRSHTLDRDRVTERSAGPENADARALRDLLNASGYGWENPLSVASFTRWRDSLRRKQDQVDTDAGTFLVRTSSPEGVLSDAALTLRATDLHAVACTLRFRSGGETIEMTEISPEKLPALVPPTLPSTPASPSGSAPAAPNAASVGDELRVIAVLHRIGADLGEPVEVQRDGASILVEVSGLTENRLDEVRAALSGIPVAQLRLQDLRAAGARVPIRPPRTAAPVDRTNPLISDLQARFGSEVSTSDLADRVIDVTDRAAERAFALRALARRFPPETASQLSTSEVDTLRGILRDHAGRLATAVQELRRLIAPILPSFTAPPVAANTARWHELAEDLPDAVERLDRAVNGATDASDARKAQLAETMAGLDRQITTLQSRVRP